MLTPDERRRQARAREDLDDGARRDEVGLRAAERTWAVEAVQAGRRERVQVRGRDGVASIGGGRVRKQELLGDRRCGCDEIVHADSRAAAWRAASPGPEAVGAASTSR